MVLRILFSICISAILLAQNPTTAENKAPEPAPAASSPSNDALKSAGALLDKGKYLEASAAFKALVEKDPKSAEAQTGLMRSFLRARKLDEALTAGKAAVASLPSSALVHATFGDVSFRCGQLSEAEQEYRSALQLDANSARGIYGMGELYSMLSMHKHAKEAFVRAHELDPNDRQIFDTWIDTLPRTERPEAFKKYIEKFPARDADDAGRIATELKLYAAEAEKKPFEQVGEIKSADIKIEPYGRQEAFVDKGFQYGNRPVSRGFGLPVKFNDKAGATLLLDTGASGILIGGKLAEKAGAVKIADSSFRGVGEGSTKSYYAWIDKIKIGDVEFKNCIVEVSSRKNIKDDSGLIGADIFEKYLITLDFQERKLRLSPLPKHPDSTGAEDEALDRYIAPEMQSFTKIYEFDDHLVVTATLGTAKRNATGLFVLDTGADSNTISVRLARQITKVSYEEGYVEGVSAKIKEVFSGDKVYLHFAGIHVLSEDITAFDHSSIAEGTEFSGLIGITTLVQTKFTIDYRDGLVKLEPYNIRPL